MHLITHMFMAKRKSVSLPNCSNQFGNPRVLVKQTIAKIENHDNSKLGNGLTKFIEAKSM